MVTFAFLGDQLKQSIPRLFHSPGLSSLSSFQARVNKVPRTLLILFLIIAKIGEVEFFVSPVFLDLDPSFEEDLVA